MMTFISKTLSVKQLLPTLFICSLAATTSSTSEEQLDTWIKLATPNMYRGLLQNISPADTIPGVVVASPSREHPNYFFHWIRDAALVMDVVVKRYAYSQGEEKAYLSERLLNFVKLTKRNQSTPNSSNGPGEPKFNPDGTPFDGPWGRPQNDGPALRAITLIHLAKVLISEGRQQQVKDLLYDGTANSVIKHDLEYVSHRWADTCFDLWEETRGHHFYTQFVQRRAMVEGAQLAGYLGDYDAAKWYQKQAGELEQALQRYWDADRRYIRATLDLDGGADYKHSNIDSATILAVLHGGLNDNFFPLYDEKVLGTVRAIEGVFREIYPVNKRGNRGVAIGRYPEDRYDGVTLNFLFEGGNPWFLTTLAFGEFYYRLAKEVEDKGIQVMNDGNRWFFEDLGYPKVHDLKGLVAAIRGRGDDFVAAVRFHMHDGHMSEQINRHTGYMQGARDLTWSYASFLTAIEHR